MVAERRGRGRRAGELAAGPTDVRMLAFMGALARRSAASSTGGPS